MTQRLEEICRRQQQFQEENNDFEREHGQNRPPRQFGQGRFEPPVTPPNKDSDIIDQNDKMDLVVLEKWIQEGGVKLNHFLFELANNIQTPVQFKDLAQMPKETKAKCMLGRIVSTTETWCIRIG